MHKILITGGAGFIGSNFVHYWKKHHPNDLLVVLDKLTYAGNFDNIANLGAYLIKGDINNKELVSGLFKAHRIDTIINFAAESHVDRSIDDSSIFMQSNMMGTHALLTVAQYFWLTKWQLANHRFHHISTDEVFGSLTPNDAPFTESHPYQPNSPYAASKAAADHLVRAFHATYGLKTSISHCSNNYGPYHYPEKLIPLCLTHILQGKSIPIYGDGKQVRDWLHVTDHCRGIEAILTKGRAGESYNIGGHDGELSNLQIVHRLCDIVDAIFQQQPKYKEQFPDAACARGYASKSLIQHVTDRLGHDRRYAINSQKIQQELDFQYHISLDSGLQQTVQWYLDHPSWWQAILQPNQKTAMLAIKGAN